MPAYAVPSATTFVAQLSLILHTDHRNARLPLTFHMLSNRQARLETLKQQKAEIESGLVLGIKSAFSLARSFSLFKASHSRKRSWRRHARPPPQRQMLQMSLSCNSDLKFTRAEEGGKEARRERERERALRERERERRGPSAGKQAQNTDVLLLFPRCSNWDN